MVTIVAEKFREKRSGSTWRADETVHLELDQRHLWVSHSQNKFETSSLHDAGIEAAQNGWDDHADDGNKIEPVKRESTVAVARMIYVLGSCGVQLETFICQGYWFYMELLLCVNGVKRNAEEQSQTKPHFPGGTRHTFPLFVKGTTH
jgi:hypothetical protein